jgi:hypothetical protein
MSSGTIPLTDEQAGQVNSTIQSHLHDLGVADSARLTCKLGVDAPILTPKHTRNIARLGAKFSICARVLAGAERGELPIDPDVLELLEDCEEARELQLDADRELEDIEFDTRELATARAVLDLTRNTMAKGGA